MDKANLDLCLHPEIKKRIRMALGEEEYKMSNPNYNIRYCTNIVSVNPPIRIPPDVVFERQGLGPDKPLWYFGEGQEIGKLASVRMCLSSYPYRWSSAIFSCDEIYERSVRVNMTSYEFYIPRMVSKSHEEQWCDHVQYFYMIEYPTLEHADALHAQELEYADDDSETSSGYSTNGDNSGQAQGVEGLDN